MGEGGGGDEEIVKLMEMLSIIQNMEWMNATGGRKAEAREMRNFRMLTSKEAEKATRLVISIVADSLGRSSHDDEYVSFELQP